MIHTDYRKDIDGLRALAVLCVVYFHAFPEKFPGGFVGVDIFFVISGYLITKIIQEEVIHKKFSIKNFYIRRVKRIIPALLVVLIAAGIFSWFFLLYEEYKQLGKHIFAGASFISNLVFWSESGYFDNSSDTKPLLHLWSLGIEEQFYIFWPIFIYLASRFKINLILLASLLAVVSFLLNIYQIEKNHIGVFYSPITRSWELLLGGLLALLQSELNQTHRLPFSKLKNITSILGFILIAVALVSIDEGAIFPGWLALLPVVGTMLLIFSSSKAIINHYFLSNKIMVSIGLISYPLYLWHWPILSFLRISEAGIPAANLRYKAIIVSMLLAYMTYRFIEKPFRFGVFFSEKLKLSLLISLVSLVGFFGLITYLNDGYLPYKKEPALNLYEGDIGHQVFNTFLFENFYACDPSHILENSPVWKSHHRCLQSQKNKKLDIALIGNSHSEHLFIGLAEEFPDKNIVFYTKSGFPTISNKEFEDIYGYVISNQNLRKVLITVDWISFKNTDSLEFELLKTIEILVKSGKQVILTDGVPTFPFDPIRCKAIRFPQTKELCSFKRVRFGYEEMLKNISVVEPKVKLINTMQFFCNATDCSMVKNQQILYRDDNHLNINGSRYVAKNIRKNYIGIFD